MIHGIFTTVSLPPAIADDPCGICQFPLNARPYEDPTIDSSVAAHNHHAPDFSWSGRFIRKIFGEKLDHYFHFDCIDGWVKSSINLQQDPTCPQCRKVTLLLSSSDEERISGVVRDNLYKYAKEILVLGPLPFMLAKLPSGEFSLGWKISQGIICIFAILGSLYIRCDVHESFTKKQIKQLRKDSTGIKLIPYVFPKNTRSETIYAFKGALIGMSLSVTAINFSIEGMQSLSNLRLALMSGALGLSILECGLKNTTKLVKNMITIAGSGMIARELAQSFGCSEMMTTAAVFSSTILVAGFQFWHTLKPANRLGALPPEPPARA